MSEKKSDIHEVRIYVTGKKYKVPYDLTIMKALEYIGYKLIRGAGCRGGFCGACATLYKVKGDYKLYVLNINKNELLEHDVLTKKQSTPIASLKNKILSHNKGGFYAAVTQPDCGLN